MFFQRNSHLHLQARNQTIISKSRDTINLLQTENLRLQKRVSELNEEIQKLKTENFCRHKTLLIGSRPAIIEATSLKLTKAFQLGTKSFNVDMFLK